jgi:hypothetical protein
MQNFSFPFVMMQGSQAAQRDDDETPPMRIQVALRFLQQLTEKVASKGIVGEVGAPLEIQGIELEPEERKAMFAACKVVTAYFEGTLKVDEWERRHKKRVRRKKEEMGTFIRCLMCGGSRQTPQGPCGLCHGAGSLLVTPADTGGW